jgi:hypothetical protein
MPSRIGGVNPFHPRFYARTHPGMATEVSTPPPARLKNRRVARRLTSSRAMSAPAI